MTPEQLKSLEVKHKDILDTETRNLVRQLMFSYGILLQANEGLANRLKVKGEPHHVNRQEVNRRLGRGVAEVAEKTA